MTNRLPLYIGLGALLAFPVIAQASDKVTVDELVVIAPEDAEAQDVPMGQGAEPEVTLLPGDSGFIDDGIFGTEGGYIHPYLSLTELYTDNVFKVDTDTTSSFITRISPGIWLSIPRKREIPVGLAPNNTSPGGLAQQIGDYEGSDRYQVYALTGADIAMYSDSSDNNTEDYFFEGLGRYNMAGGLSLQVVDRVTNGHDIFETGVTSTDNIREFNRNLLMLTADWDLTEKFRVKTDYSNFYLDYNSTDDAFLNRQDNIFDLYTYYKYSVKTSFFVQYRHTDVSYDTAAETDNTQNSYYGGIRYESTEKLSLLLKAGVQDKSFTNKAPGFDDSSNLAMDLQATYRITEKTQIAVAGYRNTEESDSEEASQREVLGVRLAYEQEITDRITAKADMNYENADYSQLSGFAEREDTSYLFRPAVQYLFRDWLMAEAAYSFETTDSSEDDFDYDTNIFSVSLNFAL